MVTQAWLHVPHSDMPTLCTNSDLYVLHLVVNPKPGFTTQPQVQLMAASNIAIDAYAFRPPAGAVIVTCVHPSRSSAPGTELTHCCAAATH